MLTALANAVNILHYITTFYKVNHIFRIFEKFVNIDSICAFWSYDWGYSIGIFIDYPSEI